MTQPLLNGSADLAALDHAHRLHRCAKILGCKPAYVENILREMYRKISECDAVLNPAPEETKH